MGRDGIAGWLIRSYFTPRVTHLSARSIRARHLGPHAAGSRLVLPIAPILLYLEYGQEPSSRVLKNRKSFFDTVHRNCSRCTWVKPRLFAAGSPSRRTDSSLRRRARRETNVNTTPQLGAAIRRPVLPRWSRLVSLWRQWAMSSAPALLPPDTLVSASPYGRAQLPSKPRLSRRDQEGRLHQPLQPRRRARRTGHQRCVWSDRRASCPVPRASHHKGDGTAPSAVQVVSQPVYLQVKSRNAGGTCRPGSLGHGYAVFTVKPTRSRRTGELPGAGTLRLRSPSPARSRSPARPG